MKKEPNYVKCEWCKDWDTAERYFRGTCRRCNDTGKVRDPKEVLCNLCGESLCPIGTYSEQIPHGLHNAKVTGGYDSYHLLDCSTYIFSFCEKCLRQLFIQCKIKPDIHDTNPFDGSFSKEENWEADMRSYEYKLWVDNGGHHQAFLDKKCNTIKDCPNKAKYTVLYSQERMFSEECCCEEHKTNRAWALNARFVTFIPDTLKAFI